MSTTPVATLLWGKCEDETHTPKIGTWESSGTPKILEFNCRGQNTSHWGVLYIIGKLVKCKCRKWHCMGHLDIFSTSYGKKKGQKSNWQFDSWPLKVGNQPDTVRAGGVRYTIEKLSRRATSLLQTSSQSRVWVKSYDLAKSQESKLGQFRDSSLGVPRQRPIRMWVPRKGTKYTIWGKVAASPESRPWWVLWVQSCPCLVLAPRVFQKVI